MKQGHDVFINGDGENSRDFCFVRDIARRSSWPPAPKMRRPLAMSSMWASAKPPASNQLFSTLRGFVEADTGRKVPDVIYRDFRAGTFCDPAQMLLIRAWLGFKPHSASLWQRLARNRGRVLELRLALPSRSLNLNRRLLTDAEHDKDRCGELLATADRLARRKFASTRPASNWRLSSACRGNSRSWKSLCATASPNRFPPPRPGQHHRGPWQQLRHAAAGSTRWRSSMQSPTAASFRRRSASFSPEPRT